MKQLLNVDEVAQALGVSRVTVYKLIHEGVLAPVRVGSTRRTLFDVLDVRAAIDSAKETPREVAP
jgi:excisionase family DNA binding protein